MDQFSTAPFQIVMKIRGDIRNFLFIAGVNGTGEKLFSGVNDISESFGKRVL
jgi:hypothetical protein